VTVTIPTKAAAPLAAADEKSGDVDELDLSQRLLTAVPPESPLSEGERKGMYAECAAFRFCAARDSGGRTWDMYWQPMSSMVQGERTMHSPSIEPINEDILAYWFNRLSAVRHPVLKARYADLAWEVTRLFKGRWTPPNAEARNPYKPNIAAALAAIDAYLDAVEHGVVVDPFRAWGFVGRAVELAASVSDTARLARAKTLLLRTWSRKQFGAIAIRFGEPTTLHGTRRRCST
jgi:hypothetical protein